LSIPHAYHGFYGFLGGFEALRYWGTDYSISLLLGLIATVLLVPSALTSFDAAATWLGRRWKRLHRLAYLAGVLALAHSVTVTIHVVDLWPWLAGTYVALLALLLLESLKIDRARRGTRRGSWPVTTSVGLPLGAGVLYWSFFPDQPSPALKCSAVAIGRGIPQASGVRASRRLAGSAQRSRAERDLTGGEPPLSSRRRSKGRRERTHGPAS
jgi:hypothetical protein